MNQMNIPLCRIFLSIDFKVLSGKTLFLYLHIINYMRLRFSELELIFCCCIYTVKTGYILSLLTVKTVLTGNL